MSHKVVVKFAPVFTPERFNDPAWTRPGRTMYERLEFAPSKDAIPLLINHDDDREIGTVHELFRMDWTDGPWICARATVNADAPSWLKRGTRASFGFGALHRRELNIRGIQPEVVARAIVREVSVLSPGREPGEPCAEVLSLRPADALREEVIYGGGKLIRPAIGQVLGVR